jgi:hypothetical protein
VGKSEGGMSCGTPRGRWEDNIELDLREAIWDSWTGSIWHRIRIGGGLL